MNIFSREVCLDYLRGYCDPRQIEIQASYSGIEYYCEDLVISQDVVVTRKSLRGLLNLLRKDIFRATRKMLNTDEPVDKDGYSFNDELFETFSIGRFGLLLERMRRKVYGGRVEETDLFFIPYAGI